jgi:8-oxo-dGTP pyrophosphatase MutT (NUDIX family)
LPLGNDNPWRTLSSKIIYDNGRLRLREDEVLQPDGTPFTYTFIEIPWPIVVVVPITEDGHVHLVRQWRYAWGQNSWEVPAGTCEPGEDPLVGARRELAEEVGLQASQWEPLGQGMTSATMSAHYHLFLARGLSPVAAAQGRDGAEHDLIVQTVPLPTAVEAVIDGRIVHVLTAVGLFHAARRLGL